MKLSAMRWAMMLCYFCISPLQQDVCLSEWTPVSPQETPQLLRVIESALSTHWTKTEKGWCRAIAHGALRSNGSPGPVEIEFSWHKDRIGYVEHQAEDTSATPEGSVKDLELMVCFTPKECWFYNSVAKSLRGQSTRKNSDLSPGREIRPQRVWLSLHNSRFKISDFVDVLTKKGVKILQESDGRVRLESPVWRLEFDLDYDYGPTLFEVGLKQSELGANEKNVRPARYQYELKKDIHGVTYCSDLIVSEWPIGAVGEPQVYHVMTVLEYDSDPQPAKMVLDYQSMPIPSNTRVTSTIPGKSGQWVYGKEHGGQSELEEADLRNLGDKLRTRGLSQPEREQAQ